MLFQGLPDFNQPTQQDNFQIFYPYGNVGSYMVMPNQLEIAEQSDGHPDFTLKLVRGQNPTLPPQPHGIVDFRLQPRYPISAALTLLRERHPNAVVEPATFSSGFLQLRPRTVATDVPEDIYTPIPLAWNGLTNVRCSLKLSDITAIFLKKALASNAFQLLAYAEMELVGVAPRIPVRVRFDPEVLLSELVALGNAQQQIACEEIFNFFNRDPKHLPLKVEGSFTSLIKFAEVMTDWIRARFGIFIPSPLADERPYIALNTEVSGSFEWDLSEPLQAYRTVTLTLNPLEAARQLVQNQGIDAIFQEISVPSIPTGMLPVEISANLPNQQLDVLEFGVTLHAAPFPPLRPQAIVQSAILSPPENKAKLLLLFSPIEEPKYTFSTFVVLQDADKGFNRIRQLEGVEIPHTGDRLYLRSDHFPVNFIPIEAAQSLLALATLQGICRWQEERVTITRSFELNQDQPAIALALSKEATDATLEIIAHSLIDLKTLQIASFPAKSCKLDLYSFPEYGSHKISVECEFVDDTPLYAIDLLPEEQAETEASVLFFTPSESRKEWSWLAKSPFQAGYRYRPHHDSGATSSNWSPIQSPFASLKLRVNSSGD